MSTIESDPPAERVIIPAEDGLELKQFVVEDASPMKAALDYNRDHLRQYGDDTGDKYTTEQEIIESIVHPKDPSRLRLGIWDKDTFIGSVNLQPREEGVAEVGYWLGKQFIGHGAAAKAVRGVSKYAFSQGYSLLFGKVHPDNNPSKRTLENAGFKFAREDMTEDGQEVLVYELSNNDDMNRLSP